MVDGVIAFFPDGLLVIINLKFRFVISFRRIWKLLLPLNEAPLTLSDLENCIEGLNSFIFCVCITTYVVT